MTQESGKTKYYVLMEELKDAILSGKIKAGDTFSFEQLVIFRNKGAFYRKVCSSGQGFRNGFFREDS